MNKSLGEQIKKVSQDPGVYLFKSKAGQILYIGKAVNLRSRLKQYLDKKTYSPFLKHILNEAEKIETKITESEIEALILESRLIKEWRPKYNIMLRDDKEYFYVILTKEKFPKIFIIHQPDTKAIGPFTDGIALKTTLRLLRRIFPYCNCKQPHNNFCFNYHIGKCLGFCCLKQLEVRSKKLEVRSYQKNINAIKDILSGKKNSLTKKLREELGALGKKQEFEKAIELRDKIKKLEKVFVNARILRTSNTEVLSEVKKVFHLSKTPNRIEGYDVSNIQGKNAAGAMVVFTNGQPDKNEYRKFKIRRKNEPDDIAMLKEMISRRLNHPEWPLPDLIFIDGGKAQLNVAIKAIAFIATFSEKGRPAIISLAKGKREIFSSTLRLRSGQAKPVALKKLPPSVQNLIRQIDFEAHRFAISYYRKIHRKILIA